MFHNFYHMYSDINNTEGMNESFLLTSISDRKYINKVIETTVKLRDNHQKEFPFHLITIVATDLDQIQPRAAQLWNCDKIGFDPNGK